MNEMTSEQFESKSRWTFFKMVHKKVPFTEDLLTAIQERWNHLHKERYFKLVKSIPERIKILIKSQGGATKY